MLQLTLRVSALCAVAVVQMCALGAEERDPWVSFIRRVVERDLDRMEAFPEFDRLAYRGLIEQAAAGDAGGLATYLKKASPDLGPSAAAESARAMGWLTAPWLAPDREVPPLKILTEAAADPAIAGRYRSMFAIYGYHLAGDPAFAVEALSSEAGGYALGYFLANTTAPRASILLESTRRLHAAIILDGEAPAWSLLEFPDDFAAVAMMAPADPAMERAVRAFVRSAEEIERWEPVRSLLRALPRSDGGKLRDIVLKTISVTWTESGYARPDWRTLIEQGVIDHGEALRMRRWMQSLSEGLPEETPSGGTAGG